MGSLSPSGGELVPFLRASGSLRVLSLGLFSFLRSVTNPFPHLMICGLLIFSGGTKNFPVTFLHFGLFPPRSAPEGILSSWSLTGHEPSLRETVLVTSVTPPRSCLTAGPPLSVTMRSPSIFMSEYCFDCPLSAIFPRLEPSSLARPPELAFLVGAPVGRQSGRAPS